MGDRSGKRGCAPNFNAWLGYRLMTLLAGKRNLAHRGSEWVRGQHYSAEGKEKDRQRDEYMVRAGITVLRFSDREVLENPH